MASGTIRLQESGLLDLKRGIEASQKNVDSIKKTLHEATHGSGWKSDAATSFKAVWQEREKVLTELAKVLDQWELALKKQAAVAANVNQAFR